MNAVKQQQQPPPPRIFCSQYQIFKFVGVFDECSTCICNSNVFHPFVNPPHHSYRHQSLKSIDLNISININLNGLQVRLDIYRIDK